MDKIREVRIVPRGVGYTIEIVYKKHLPREVRKNKKRKGALDLGLSNLITFVDNIGSRPIVVKLELEPNGWSETYIKMAECYKELGNYEKSIEYIDKGRELEIIKKRRNG